MKSAGAKRFGHAAARLTAVLGGVLLTLSAALAYFIAGYADDAIGAGRGAAEDALRSGRTGLDGKTADDAADWLHRLSNWMISGRPGEFRTYAVIAMAAGVIAIAVALLRRPDAVWPEIVWALAAVAGLAPNLAFDFWFSVWLFSGALIAAAAVAHYLARRDDHVRRAGEVAVRAGVAAAPHVGSALARGQQAAAGALARARAGAAAREAPPTAAATTAPAAAPAPIAAPAPAALAPPTPPAGWYDDPHGHAPQRWWDGAAWTDRTS